MAQATREEVYRALDGERAYQETRWNRETTESGGIHESVGDWLIYMGDYIQEAKHFISRNGEPEAREFALHNIRKVGALAVAAMEQCGVRLRE